MRTVLERLARRQDGVTVIELALVAGIFMLVLATVTAVLQVATKLEAGTGARSQKLDELRGALDRVSKDVRQAVTVDLASSQSRLVMNAYVAGTETPVEYVVTGGKLMRRVSGGGNVAIVDGLTTSAVFCYDPPTCVLAAPASRVPAILRLVLVAKPKTANAQPVTLTTEIQLRNARND